MARLCPNLFTQHHLFRKISKNVLHQTLVVFAATFLLLIAGLHTGWAAPSLPKLNSTDYPFNITSEEGSYITIIGNVANIFGSFATSLLLDIIGRQKLLMLIAVPQVLSFLCYIIADFAKELLYVARICGGFSEGAALCSVFIYIGEVTEPKIRGILCTLGSIAIYSGVLIINLVGSYLSVPLTGAALIALPIIFILCFWRMPESPYFLIMKNREEEATKTLQFLRGKSDVGTELENLKDDVTRQLSEPGTFLDVFRIESNRKAVILTSGARFFQVATGTLAFNNYLQELLKDPDEDLDPVIGSSVILFIQVLVTLLSTIAIDRQGRKPLLVVSTIGCFIHLLIQTIYFIIIEYPDSHVLPISWFPLVMLVINMFLFAIGLGVVVSVMTSEMFSSSVKAKSACLTNSVYSLSILLSTKYYQSMSEIYGMTVPFATFLVITFFAIIFFYYLMPETKGKTLEQIQQSLKKTKNVI